MLPESIMARLGRLLLVIFITSKGDECFDEECETSSAASSGARKGQQLLQAGIASTAAGSMASAAVVKQAPSPAVMQAPSQSKFGRNQRYALDVTILSAEDLKDADSGLNGKSDPWCLIRYQDREFKSSVVEDTTNPSWNQKFDIGAYRPGVPLEFEVQDSDAFGNTDLGKAMLSSQFFFPHGIEVSLDLTGNDMQHTSHLTVRIAVRPFDFDCNAGQSKSVDGWSEEKMSFCCMHYNVSCAA